MARRLLCCRYQSSRKSNGESHAIENKKPNPFERAVCRNRARRGSRRLFPGRRADVGSSQLPATNGTVRQYTLTPRGDVDGLILTDGTEVKVPPHLTGQIVYSIHPGDAVTIRGMRARALPLVQAESITNNANGRTVADNGPPGPVGAGPETTLSGRVSATLHGARGEVNGALLDNGIVLRLPPPEADRMQALLQPGQIIALRGARTRYRARQRHRCSRDRILSRSAQ